MARWRPDAACRARQPRPASSPSRHRDRAEPAPEHRRHRQVGIGAAGKGATTQTAVLEGRGPAFLAAASGWRRRSDGRGRRKPGWQPRASPRKAAQGSWHPATQRPMRCWRAKPRWILPPRRRPMAALSRRPAARGNGQFSIRRVAAPTGLKSGRQTERSGAAWCGAPARPRSGHRSAIPAPT